MEKRRTYKQQALTRLSIFIGIIIFLNVLASVFFIRIDLTSDKRFTFTDSTKKLLSGLNDVVFVKVYLQGDMPPGFQRISTATREVLDEFKAYGGDNIQYDFEDPTAGKTQSELQGVLKQLSEKGLEPTNVQQNAGDQYSEKIVVPGAIVYYKGKEAPVQLLEAHPGENPQTSLNNSVAHLEYDFTQAIQKLSMRQLPKVGFIKGEGEIEDARLSDFASSLSKFYTAQSIDLPNVISISKSFNTIIITKPALQFTEKDKYKIDQYIMNGGNVLWMVEPLNADMDSLVKKRSFITLDLPLDLDDQLFKYGARINPDLIMDLQCTPVPLLVSYENQKPDFKLFPCLYFPVFTPTADHPIVKNVDAVATKFTSSIDTVAAPGIKKTILLHSSDNSRNVFTPWMVDFGELKSRPDIALYNKKNLIAAVLLEGSFSSIFTNRLTPEALKLMADSMKMPFRERSDPAKMIVISDGDIACNEVNSQGQPLPLGYDRFGGEYFGNKNFLLNSVDYLSGFSQYIGTRSKTVKLRLLDVTKVKEQQLQWQLINILVPLAALMLFGVVFNFFRKRKYTA